jgi:hypothetical protein
VVAEYRQVANTTEPVWDPEGILGHDVVWDRDLRRVALSMEKKICQLVKQHGEEGLVMRVVPVSESMVVVNEDELEKLGEDGRILSEAERRGYQRLIGG